MIYQLYHRSEQIPRLFQTDPYLSLGLEPDVNEYITNVVSELRRGVIRNALCEYGGMILVNRLGIYRHDSWVGFTSWRQTDKGVPQLTRQDIECALSGARIASWGKYHVSGRMISTVRNLALFENIFGSVGLSIPTDWYNKDVGTFGNYWAASWTDFDDYMIWSRPFLTWIMRNYDNCPSLQSAGPSAEPFVGEFFERLFDIWCTIYQKDVHHLYHIRPTASLSRSHDTRGPDL